MPEKIVRDPVHDVIAFNLDDPAEKLLFHLMNAGEFQRLRRIRQLGMASLVYPGADHSRYSHSLGVMATARLMLDRLGREFTIDSHDRTVCLVAALLHDLGHGPFSHVFERVTGVHHERLTTRLILDPESEIHRQLITYDRALPEEVVELLNGNATQPFLADIISSQLDADRLDYLLRDNLMTGSRYGGYDLRWLLQAMTLDPVSKRLVVLPKAISAVESYLQSRYHMYRNVYFHKVVRSAEGMLKLALRRARLLAVQDRLSWPGREDGVSLALTGQRLSAVQFRGLDDVSLLQCFKIWADGGDAILARLCRGLLYRQLFKTIDLSDRPDAADIAAKVREAIAASGTDPEFAMFYDEPRDTPYPVELASDKPQKQIMLLQSNGKLVDIAKASPMTEALNKQLGFRRLHVASEHRDRAAEIVSRGQPKT